jgi:RNase P subunit RPR2
MNCKKCDIPMIATGPLRTGYRAHDVSITESYQYRHWTCPKCGTGYREVIR